MTAPDRNADSDRQGLIERHSRLVWGIVNRFSGRGEEVADLFQVGCVGLLKAADRFDPALGTQFSTFAVPTIMGEIKRHLRDLGPIRVSRRLKEVAVLSSRTRSELAHRLAREPTLDEVAVATGIAVDELVQAMEAAAAPVSLYAPTGDGDAATVVLDSIADGQTGDRMLDRIALRQALALLPPRQRLIINWRYFSGLTQSAIATRLGLSQAQVSRLEKQALKLMRPQLRS